MRGASWPLDSSARLDARPKNRLLAALPASDFARLSEHLTIVPVKTKQVFHRQGEPIDFVVFPNGGVFSVVSVLAGGTTVEAATVGDEGMIGVEAYLTEAPVAVAETMMQVPDTDAVLLPVPALRRELARNGVLAELLGRYARALVAQTIQLTACNATHALPERCARWLLMTHDRVHADEFQLSHEFLATMLAVQRPTVTQVAGRLQRAGLIHYRRGRLRIMDRKRLEEASCECYANMRAHFDLMR